jgi:hypothetical protein
MQSDPEIPYFRQEASDRHPIKKATVVSIIESDQAGLR